MTPMQMVEEIELLKLASRKNLEVFYAVRDFLSEGKPCRKRDLVEVLGVVRNAIARLENPTDRRFQ